MDDDHAYMSSLESANMDPSIMEDSAEDSDAAGSSLAASATGRKGRSNGSNGAQEVGDKRKRAHGSGKRKIAIEYIKDKKARAVCFTKRKGGIFTKARELSALTGSSILLLVVSESGSVFSYTTEKFQPMVTQDVGKNMIAACLNGTVNLDERFNTASSVGSGSSATAKKGGNLLLRDAYGAAAPAVSSTVYASAQAGPSRPSPTAVPISGIRDASSGTASLVQEGGIVLPPLPEPQVPNAENENKVDLVKVPRLRSNPSQEQHDSEEGHLSLGYGNHDSALAHLGAGSQVEEHDLSEGECEAQMRKLRRSLSIERRFDKAAEEERPRLLRHGDAKGEPVDTEVERARTMEERQGWSFTAAADAWDGFRNRFSRPAYQRPDYNIPDRDGSRREHADYNAGTSQDRTGNIERSRNEKSRRPPQVMTLPELPS